MKRHKDINQLLTQTERLEEKEYFSMKEVLEILSITDTTLYRYIGNGQLNKIKLFGRTWFKGSELIDFIQSEIHTQSLSK